MEVTDLYNTVMHSDLRNLKGAGFIPPRLTSRSQTGFWLLKSEVKDNSLACHQLMYSATSLKGLWGVLVIPVSLKWQSTSHWEGIQDRCLDGLAL